MPDMNKDDSFIETEHLTYNSLCREHGWQVCWDKILIFQDGRRTHKKVIWLLSNYLIFMNHSKHKGNSRIMYDEP